MKIIWHGTAAIELINEKGRILFDPFVPLRHSNVDVHLEEYDGFSDIFITHGHFDHIVNIPDIVKRNPQVKIYCTQTPYRTLVKKGVPNDNLVEIYFNQELSINGFVIHTYHGKHARLPIFDIPRLFRMFKSKAIDNLKGIIKELFVCKEKRETVFYLIKGDDKYVSLMGSNNLRKDVSYPKNSDVLILPYNGWKDNYKPAINTINTLKPKRVLLDHYDDTFPPITTSIDLTPIIAEKDYYVSALKLHQEEIV